MGFFGNEDFSHFAVAAVASALIGYAVPWALDRLLLRRVMADRVAAIALGGAFVFLALMAGTTVYLTWTSPFFERPIIIPPVGFAISFLLGTAAAGAARLAVYSHYEQNLDEPIVFEPDYDDLSRYDAELDAWDEKHGHKNYLSRHWAGHLSLPLSYWVNGALLSVVVFGAAEFLAHRIRTGGGSLRWLAIVALLYLAVSTLLWIWSSVGIWRSAYWHRRRGGSPGWGFAARSLILLSAALTLFRSQDIALQAAELGTLATGRDSLGAVARMEVSKDGHDLILRGTLAQGAASRFRALLAGHPGVTDVILTSPGGRMLEAERIAAAVRERRLDTRVDRDCMSACTFILLAGRERTAPEGARIGFHQPAFPGLDSAEMRGAIEESRAAYLGAGVDPAFTWRAMTTPAEGMWFPSQDELLAAHVLTGTDFLVSAETPERKASRKAAERQRLLAQLAAMAAAVNRDAPVRLGPKTTLERASVSGAILTQVYTLRLPGVTRVRPSPQLSADLRREACGDPVIGPAIRDGGALVHSYRDAGGRTLFQITVSRCPL
jgi:hypothetical protein